MTCESDNNTALRTPSAFNFRRPNSTASYSATLLVVPGNSSLTAKDGVMAEGDRTIAAAPAPCAVQEPSQ